MTAQLLSERVDSTLILTISNPEARNALHPDIYAASQEALDVAAFRLADGRRIVLLDDWEGDDSAATFLRRVRDGACDVFGTTLGPDYNAAHANHFHLGMQGMSLCR